MLFGSPDNENTGTRKFAYLWRVAPELVSSFSGFKVTISFLSPSNWPELMHFSLDPSIFLIFTSSFSPCDQIKSMLAHISSINAQGTLRSYFSEYPQPWLYSLEPNYYPLRYTIHYEKHACVS